MLNFIFRIFIFILIASPIAHAQKSSLKWGLIDKTGKIIAPFDFYINVKEFSNGLCAVQSTSTKWGYINNQGQTVVPFEYDFAENFKNGMAIVGKKGKPNTFGIIDYKGKEILPIKYKVVQQLHKGIYLYGNKKFGLIDQQGNIIVKAIFDHILPNSYGDGLIPVQKNGLWGYLDEEGNMSIDFKFFQASPFVQGKALVMLTKTAKELVLIDKEGQKLHTFPHQITKNIHKTARLRKDGYIEIEACEQFDDSGKCKQVLIGLQNSEGTTFVKPMYATISLFNKGKAIVSTSSSEKGIIDEEGIVEVPTAFTQLFPFQNGKALALEVEHATFVIDAKGEKTEDLGTYMLGEASEKLIPATKCDDCSPTNTKLKWGFLTLDGKWMIDMQFTAAQPFKEGFAPVRDKTGKWGFIDSEGSVTVPYTFDEAKPFNNNVAWVAKKIADK